MVEINSIGPEILLRMVPKECFVVILRLGMLSTTSCDLFRLVVNALERDIIAEEDRWPEDRGSMGCLLSINEVVVVWVGSADNLQGAEVQCD